MNLKIIVFILCILLLPIIVNAEECDISKIYITTMHQNKIEGQTEEINDLLEEMLHDENVNKYDSVLKSYLERRWNYSSVSSKYGIKPVISLISNNRITSGTGSEENPWIIE